MSTEDLLRDTLHAKADEAAARLTVDDVRRGVLERHRHARRRMVLVAAAAAVLAAVAVPSALLLRPDDGTPSPAPSPGTCGTVGLISVPSPAAARSRAMPWTPMQSWRLGVIDTSITGSLRPA